MDRFDCEKLAAVYRLLAQVLERDPPPDRSEGNFSFVLGDLTRRIFVGNPVHPPDEILEEVAQAWRAGETRRRKHVARRLLEHATRLDALLTDAPEEGDK